MIVKDNNIVPFGKYKGLPVEAMHNECLISGKSDPYREYERCKKEIQSQNLTPREYEKAIRRVADECNI